jgi:hypothetical protein
MRDIEAGNSCRLPVNQGVRRQEKSSEARWKLHTDSVRGIYPAVRARVNRDFVKSRRSSSRR